MRNFILRAFAEGNANVRGTSTTASGVLKREQERVTNNKRANRANTTAPTPRQRANA